MLADVTACRLSELDGPDGPDTCRAGKDDSLARGQSCRVEHRQRMGHGAWNMSGGELMRLTDIDQDEGAFLESLFDGLAVEIDDLRRFTQE